jgi:hypothetical protein
MTKRNKMKVAEKLRVALPCILIFSALGALVGSTMDANPGAIRVGIVSGGVVAFFILQRKNTGKS